MFFLVCLGAWFIYRAHEEASRIIHLRQEWGYKLETEDYAKYKSRSRVLGGVMIATGICGMLLYGVELSHRF